MLRCSSKVSVGECALVPPSSNQMSQAAEYRFSYGGKVLGAGPGSLWIEEREGRIQVLDIKVCLAIGWWHGPAR